MVYPATPNRRAIALTYVRFWGNGHRAANLTPDQLYDDLARASGKQDGTS